jgi:hypothetical protein
MSNEPDVSVVVVGWRGAEHLRRCLESVIRAKPPRLLVVLNGKACRSMRDWAGIFMPDVFVEMPHDSGENVVVSEAVRLGLEAAEFTLIVEDDVLIAPDCLDYVRWAKERYRDDPKVATITAEGMISNHVPWGRPVWHSATRSRVFHRTAWGTWRHKRGMLGSWPGKDSLSWATMLRDHYITQGFHTIQPAVGRATNNRFDYDDPDPAKLHTPVWTGPFVMPEGVWQEA